MNDLNERQIFFLMPSQWLIIAAKRKKKQPCILKSFGNSVSLVAEALFFNLTC